MHTATRAYASVAKETASPRELEATLLLKAAAKLQAVHDTWEDRRGLDEDAPARRVIARRKPGGHYREGH